MSLFRRNNPRNKWLTRSAGKFCFSWLRGNNVVFDQLAMPAPASISWTELFESTAPSDTSFELWVLKKSGIPFLLLPLSPTLAAHSLSLYPAQTRLAKLAKSLLRAALEARLPIPLAKTSVNLSREDPFPKFLADLFDAKSQPFPSLAILAGNPRTEGRRFILLLFNEQGEPAFVVKAGIGESARQLIRHEIAFLHSAPTGIPGLPSILGSFDAGNVSAMALDFISGDSPAAGDWPTAGKLLSSWIDDARQIQIQEMPAWQALEKARSSDPLFNQLAQKLGNFSFHPVMFHGDFAPWNIKLSSEDKSWSVLDWERGDLTGIPGWDWFHYVIQTGVLVQKQKPESVFRIIEQLLDSIAFQNYALHARIKGREKVLVIAYLFHLINVVGPSEGLETCHSLLSLLCQRWLS